MDTATKKVSPMKIFTEIIKYLIFPIALFVLFKKVLGRLMENFVAGPILSYIDTASTKYDVACIIIVLVFTIPILYKMIKGAVIPFRWLLILVFFCFAYLIFRTDDITFIYTASWFFSTFMLTDYFVLIPGIIILSAILQVSFSKDEKNEQVDADTYSGFQVDIAKLLSETDDSLNRVKFMKELVNKIRQTESKEGSFPIGIVGRWGSGKTTFVNSLIEEVKNDFILIELNAWKYNNPGQMISSFFNLLKEKLSQFSFTIDNKIDSYSKLLIKGTKYESALDIKGIGDIFLSDPSIENQYDSLRREITRIGRKIIVVIDDMDRLDKKEIYEVIRLVRNTANFPNTFFIVAYDRNYILSALHEINPTHSHYFLEKIFQLEFTLPPIEKEMIQNEITKRMESVLTIKGKAGYKELVEIGGDYFFYNTGNTTPLFIQNIRDAVRFISSFRLSYEFVKDEIYFPDFYNLELIRFKHPEVFAEFYRRYSEILTTDHDNSDRYTGNTYTLSFIKDPEGIVTRSQLYDILMASNDSLKLSKQNIDVICSAFGSIFGNPKDMLQARRESADSHLSVIKPSMFNRYFFLGIEGQLSEIEFSKLRVLPADEFVKKALAEYKDPNISYELNQRLQAITEFDDQEDFKKIVTVIFELSNHPIETPTIDKIPGRFINYETEDLAKLIGNERNIDFFDSKEEYKSFLEPFLQNDTGYFRFGDDFLKSLIKRNIHYISDLFTDTELMNTLFLNFSCAIKKHSKLNIHLWQFFNVCIDRNLTPAGNGTTHIEYPIQKRAIKVLQDFISKNDMDGFISLNIRELHFDKLFTIDASVCNVIYESLENFIEYLRQYDGNSIYKEEFLKLYDRIKNGEIKSVSKDFFKKIPVKLRDETGPAALSE